MGVQNGCLDLNTVHAWLDDSDDHLRWLAPTDLNLDYMGITHLDCLTLVPPATGLPFCHNPPGWGVGGIRITCPNQCRVFLNIII